MNSKLKIVFLGTPDYLDPIIKALQINFDLVKTIRSSKEFNNLTIEQFNNLNPDLFVVASFGKIIPEEILKLPKLGAINIHPSDLPKYRGPSPLPAQILDGVTSSAISYILMDSEIDHGPILLKKDYQILPNDTFGSLCQRIFEESALYLPEVINGLANGSITPREQNHSEATFTNLVEKEDGYFDIENPPEPTELERMIRAYYPWPTTWTKWSPSAKASEDKKGKIVKLLPEGKIQMEGKNPTDLKSFLNGYPDFPLNDF